MNSKRQEKEKLSQAGTDWRLRNVRDISYCAIALWVQLGI